MVTPHRSMPDDEVDQLMLNARLRDELEPYLDESVQLVNVRGMPTQDENEFLCPCHNAHFDLTGKRKDENSPSPRDLDTLDVEIRNGSDVWVKFQNFRTGIPNKVVEA